MSKIAIFGYNPVSYEAISRLDRTQYEVVIIESDPQLQQLARDKGLTVSTIDFRSDEGLKAIGIGRDVDVVLCFLPEDSKNVFLAISARALDPNLKIIAIVEQPQAADKLLAAGVNKIIDPYQICGQKIHELVSKPEITHIMDHTVFGRHDMHLAEIVIPPGSVFENLYTSELNINEHHNLVLIGVVDKELGDELHFAVSEKDHKLDAGDIIVVLGPSREIKALKQEICHV